MIPTNVKLTGYGGQKLKVEGKCDITCKHKGKSEKLSFYVVNTPSPPVLGLKACMDMNLIKVIMSVSSEDRTKSILGEYSQIFKGLGCLKEPYHIKIDPSVSPVIHPPRKVPTALREKLKTTLDEMEQNGVIRKVDEPTDWVSSLVIVEKRNSDKLRICLDPKDLNVAIKREHYQLPTIEDITSRMAGAKVFSKIDLNNRFWQLPHDEESQLLTTFNTPFGRFCYRKMLFGIKSAQEVFQKRISQHFDSIPGVESDIDDLLIWSKSDDEHDKILKTVLDKCVELNITLNKDKCVFKVPVIEYIGHKISADGVHADPNKVKAITEMPPPTDKKGVERLLGTVNYLAKFVPNMSTVIEPIRTLLRHDVEFEWSNQQDKAFQQIKDILSSKPVLKFFDVKLAVTISCDASKSGLGCCLLQENKPVAFASRSLTSAEHGYCQLEKELLAAQFALERFHQFTYGKDVFIESDHKPLEAIVRKPLSKAPPRLQRMFLRMQRYTYTIKYRPGTELVVADTLSRAYLPDSKSDFNTEIEEYIHSFEENLPVSKDKLQEIKLAISTDPVMINLQETVLKGWPEKRSQSPINIHEYWISRDELSVVNGLILKGDRLVIPKTMRQEILKKLHVGHFGMEKTKNRARDVLYWPGMDSEITDMIAKCTICLEHRNPTQQKEPMLSHEIPSERFQKVATDLFHWNDSDYLIIVDYYSRYFEIAQLRNAKSSSVIQHTKSIFARHGIPEFVVSDAGPCYKSEEYGKFAADWGFVHQFSDPSYPKRNGLAEKYVQIAKKLLEKAKCSGRDPYLALLEYRNTPIDNIGSPAQLLMNRRLRSILPITKKQLQPKVIKK